MGGSEENITRTEKFKITGIIAVAIFIVSMMLWSSFEIHIQRFVAGIFDNIQSFLSGISNTIAVTFFDVLYSLPVAIE